MKRYNSFGTAIRERFGRTVYKVNVDAGFTCPNRDGTLGVTGCIYCNNDSFRPSSCIPSLSIREQVRKGISHVRKRYRADRFLVYFQAFTNTYAPAALLHSMYLEALEDPDVIGIAIGTRPDAIDEEKLAMIEELASRKLVLIEFGLQSIYARSLDFIRRGHDYGAFLKALDMTKGRGIEIGAHIIAGFPTETRDETLAMADELSQLPISYLKIHQLQVVRDTPLADLYAVSPFSTFGYEEYLDFLVDFIERLPSNIVLQRLFATAPDEILIAPQWGRNRQQILRDIGQRFEDRNALQGRRCHIRASL